MTWPTCGFTNCRARGGALTSCPPSISRTSEFKLRVVGGGTSQRYGFRAKELDFFADLSVNPWSE